MSRPSRRPLQITSSLLFGVALLLGTSACDSKDGESPSLLVVADDSEQMLADLEFGGQSFMERVVDAPNTVAFEGTRRMTFAATESAAIGESENGAFEAGDSEFSNPGHRTVYLEEVWADGSGRFTVTPIDLLEPYLPLDETQQFLILQQQRERFLYLHRDFQIRNLELFRQNWSLVVEEQDAEFLGRSALIAKVERLGDFLQDRSYRVTFDVDTGLVLSYVELDGRDRPIAVVEYESFEVLSAPESSALPLGLHDREGEGSFALNSTADGDLTAGDESTEVETPEGQEGASDVVPSTPPLVEDFSPTSLLEARESLNTNGLRIPAVAPKGFRLMKKTVLTDPFESRWLRLIYSDGVEELFVAIEFDRHPQSPIGIQSQVLAVDGHNGDTEPQREDWIEVYSSGNWSVAQGEFRVSSILAVGKMHHRDLLAMLQSSLQ